MQEIQQLKLKTGCADCGYRDHAVALDFDHVRGQKLANVTKLMHGGIGLPKILDEIAKCEVVCANCHRVRTAQRGNHPG